MLPGPCSLRGLSRRIPPWLFLAPGRGKQSSAFLGLKIHHQSLPPLSRGPVCVCHCLFSSPYKDRSHTGLRAHPTPVGPCCNLTSYICNYICFQINAEVLEVRISLGHFEGTQVNPEQAVTFKLTVIFLLIITQGLEFVLPLLKTHEVLASAPHALSWNNTEKISLGPAQGWHANS